MVTRQQTNIMYVVFIVVSLFLSACTTGTQNNLDTQPDDGETFCCEALTAQCLACSQGVTVEEYCKENSDVVGCEEYSTTTEKYSEESDSMDDDSQVPSTPPVPDDSMIDVDMDTDKKTEEEKVKETLTQVIADGTYTNEVSYRSPAGIDLMEVSLSVENDIVTEVSLISIDSHRTSERFQEGVHEGLQELVIGKKIDELNLPNQISGSSLTTAAFKEHVEELIAEH